MSEPLLRYGLLAYYVVFILFAVVLRWVLVYRRTGINPFVLPREDRLQGIAAAGLESVTAGGAAVVLLIAFAPSAGAVLGAPADLRSADMAVAGGLLLGLSLLWLVAAQAQMGASWRVGIDAAHRTDLVQHGLFALSRNPIFLALRVNLLGLLLVYPAAATLVLLVAGEIFIQLQVRVEERYLRSAHGAAYAAYCAKVRRWL